MKRTILLIPFIFFLSSALFSSELVKNGDFSKGTRGWTQNSSGDMEIKKGKDTSYAYIKNTSPRYADFSQYIPVNHKETRQLTIKAEIKIKDVVPGAQEWEMARIMVLFFDGKNNQVGGWPELGRWQGTSGRSEKINIISVPEGAEKMQLQLQMANCTGEFWVYDISVKPGGELNIPREKNNFIQNGDMEFGADKPFYWGGWINGTGSFESPGYESPNCYKIHNDKKAYSMITQKIPIDPDAYVLILTGYVKTKNIVPGSNTWEKARISLEFHDKSGNRTGGWPDVAGETTDNISEWTKWENSYLIPEGAAFAEIAAGLLQASGTMWLDKISVVQRTKNGDDIHPVIAQKENRDDWWEFSAKKDPYSDDSVIDMSYTLDAPAGKHGFIKTTPNGRLEFENKTPALFWGTNIVAGSIFGTKEETDLMVKRLAKLGCNLVRLHHMDAPWSDPGLIKKDRNHTKEFDKESLDRLDYLVYKLKEAGIYIFLDFLVHREAKKGDGVDNYESVPRGFKEVIFFDERLKELTKDYIKKLLEHENKYTKTRYKNEPAIVFSEMVNESTLFYIDRNPDVSEYHIKKLDILFNRYLKNKYKTMEDLKQAWDEAGKNNLKDSENFNDNSVKRAVFDVNWEDWKTMFSCTGAGRCADTKKFYAETEIKFYDEIYDYIRSLGFKGLISGSNHWELWDAELFVNSRYDFIDRHSYWDHPTGGWTLGENISYKNLPILKSQKNSAAELAHQRILGKPFTVSEWNWLAPNQYRSGAPVIMAAYAKFQGWDAMMQFDFAQHKWTNTITHFADFSGWYDTLSQWPLAVMIFRNGYVQTGKNSIVEYVSEDDMFNNTSSSFKAVNGDYMSSHMIKIYKTFDKSKASKPFNPRTKKGAALSMTGELYWNHREGIFQLNTPKIQGITGFLKRKKSFRMPDITVQSKTEYASVYAASLDGENIASSEKLLINTAGEIANSNMIYGSSRTSIISGGTSPIIIEPVYADIELRVNKFKAAEIYRLDENGCKNGKYSNYTINSAHNKINLITDEKSKCLNFYIELSR